MVERWGPASLVHTDPSMRLHENWPGTHAQCPGAGPCRSMNVPLASNAEAVATGPGRGGNLCECWLEGVKKKGTFGAWPGLLLPKAGSEQLHPEPGRHAANGQGGPVRTGNEKEQNQATLPKPRREGKKQRALLGGENEPAQRDASHRLRWELLAEISGCGETTTLALCKTW